MGSSANFAKTILMPASIALTVYLLFNLVIIPFLRRYQRRYSPSLPLHTISAHTVSLRDRIADTIMRFFLPSSWRAGAHLDDHQNIDIDDEEGEMLVGMNRDAARRQALGRRQPTTAETESRLSRELEEGFMDDSDEEDSEQGNAESRR